MSVTAIFCCLLLFISCTLFGAGDEVEMNDGRIVLNLALLYSKSGGFISSGSIPAARLAVEYINNDSTILPDYYLNIIDIDDQCREVPALDGYFDHWRNAVQPSPFFFGGGCSAATGPPGDVSRNFNTVQMANIAGSPIFSDKDRFPHLFRALPPEPGIHFSQGIFVNHFGWTEVAYVVQNQHLFAADLPDVEAYFRDYLTIPNARTYLFPSGVPLRGLELFWTEVPRVTIVNGFEPEVREVLCEAYKRGYLYPNYQFIIVGWYAVDFWVASVNDTAPPSCTPAEYEKFILPNLITVDFNFFAENRTAHGIYNLSTETFLKEYRGLLDNGSSDGSFTFSATTFDAVYAAALTMNNSLPELADAGFSLENYTFENSDRSKQYADILENHLINISFTGVSGPFVFNKDQDREVNKTEVRQWRYNRTNGMWGQEVVGQVQIPERMFTYVNGESEETVFPQGVPRDTLVTIHLALYFVMVILATVGILFSVFCIVFNFVFRNKRFIKLTSPNLSYSMPMGAILLFAVVIVLGAPTSDLGKSITCNVELWLGCIGFTLIFGGILVRTWRIHYIFNHIVVSKISQKPPKDWMLILAIGVFLLIDLVFLTLFTGVPHIRLKAVRADVAMSNSVIDICSADVDYVTIIVLLMYKSAYMFVGLYLAFETRKVKVKALADSQYIAASVYVSIMTCIAIVPVAIWLREMIDIHYGLLSAILMLGVATVLALVFLPKMIGLYKARNTDDNELTSNFYSGSKPTAMTTNDSGDVVVKLHQKVHELEDRLALYESNGSALETRERRVTIQDSREDVCQP